MRFDAATEHKIFALYQQCLRDSELRRRWNPWESPDWKTAAPKPSASLTNAVLALYKNALFLPDYNAAPLRAVRGSRGRAWFWTLWCHEESKHLFALNEWLLQRGVHTDAELKSLSEDLLRASYWEAPKDESAVVLYVDTLIYELSEIEELTKLQALAESEGDQALAQAARFIRTDDESHRDFLTNVLTLIGEGYPEKLHAAINATAAAHKSPTLAADLRRYLLTD
jgi:acyl-[acyl-carrier-protein] desaturase